MLLGDAKPCQDQPHLSLDALLQGNHSESLRGGHCQGGLQGAAVGICLQLIVLNRRESHLERLGIGDQGLEEGGRLVG